MIALKGHIDKITTSVSKDGDIIMKLTFVHNLSGSGTLTTSSELAEVQGKSITFSIESDQAELSFSKGDEAS